MHIMHGSNYAADGRTLGAVGLKIRPNDASGLPARTVVIEEEGDDVRPAVTANGLGIWNAAEASAHDCKLEDK